LGGTDDEDTPEDAGHDASNWVSNLFSTPEELGGSQLGGAPLFATQGTQDVKTPVPEHTGRPTRQVAPPDPFTYSQHQTRAAQQAARAGQRHKRGRI